MAPNTRTHGALQSELTIAIGTHLRAHRPACSIIANPGIVPRVFGQMNVRIPDLTVTCAPYVMEQATLGDPVLVIEILLPSNERQTRSNVWTYASIPTMQEILIVDSGQILAEILRRQPDGSWPADPEMLTDGDLVLDSIGLRVALADIYRTTRLAGRAASV